MISASVYRKAITQFIAQLLQLCFLYQLGACPCGCWEHNAWVQMFGVDRVDAEILSPSTVTQPLVVSAGHECAGQGQTHYVDNSRPLNVSERKERIATAWSDHTLDLLITRGNRDGLWAIPPPDGEFRRPPSLAVLQVFRI